MRVRARSAAAAPFYLLQVLEVNQGEGRELTRCKVDPEEATFDEARLSRSGQQAGSIILTNKNFFYYIILTCPLINYNSIFVFFFNLLYQTPMKSRTLRKMYFKYNFFYQQRINKIK